MKRNIIQKLTSGVIAITMGVSLSYGEDGQLIDQDNMTFRVISDLEGTAELVKYFGQDEDVVIPDRISVHGVDYSIVKVCSKSFEPDSYEPHDPSMKVIKSIFIPETIKTIEDDAMLYLEGLQSLVIPNSVEGKVALTWLPNLQDFVIGANVNECNLPWVDANSWYLFPSTPPKLYYGYLKYCDANNLYISKDTYKEYRDYPEKPYDYDGGPMGDWSSLDALSSSWHYLFSDKTDVHKFTANDKFLIPSRTNLEFPADFDCKFWFHFLDSGGNNLIPSMVSFTSDDLDINYNDGIVRCSKSGKGKAILSVTDSEGQIFSREINLTVNPAQIIVDGIVFKITDVEECEVGVSGYIGNGGNVEIPSSVKIDGKNYSVTSILEGAFKENKTYCSNPLTGIRMPYTIKSIEKNAFENCKQLTVVSLPENLEVVEDDILLNTSLNTLSIGKSVNLVKSISLGAASSLSGNPNYTLPNLYCFPLFPPATYKGAFGRLSVNNMYLPENSIQLYQLVWPQDKDGKPVASENGRWNYIMDNVIPMPNKVLIPSNTELHPKHGQSMPLWFDLLDKEGNEVEVLSYEWILQNGAGTVNGDILTFDGGSDVLFLEVTDVKGESFTCSIPVSEDLSGSVQIYDSDMNADSGQSDKDRIYNLQGMPINISRENLPFGIYIINGHKTIIK